MRVKFDENCGNLLQLDSKVRVLMRPDVQSLNATRFWNHKAIKGSSFKHDTALVPEAKCSLGTPGNRDVLARLRID